MYVSTKTYGHDIGLSCAFRQWKATDSHCRFLHGYALAVRLEFEASELDHRNWVVDFGGLKAVKEWLQSMFDHKTICAFDDPKIQWYKQAKELGLADVVWVNEVGCEAFAELIFNWVESWLDTYQGDNRNRKRVNLYRVEVREHGANSAVFRRGN